MDLYVKKNEAFLEEKWMSVKKTCHLEISAYEL